MNIDFRDCLVHYQNHGIQFLYPDIWQIHEESADADIVITVAASDTCFWTLRILPQCPPPPQVVSSCVTAFEEEYEDAEVEKSECYLAEMPAYSRDIEFFCLELMNSVGLRSVRTTDFTLLVWWQATHQELEECRPVIEQMTLSVRVDKLID